VPERLTRVFRLAAKYYATSLTLWLSSAPPLIIGVVFTELTDASTSGTSFQVLLAGVAAHVALGIVLWVGGRTVLHPNKRDTAGWRDVIGVYVVGGAARGVTFGLMLGFLGVGETNFPVRITTSIILITFSYTVFSYGAQLWWEYRVKRRVLLMSIAVGEQSGARQDIATSKYGPVALLDVEADVATIRQQTAEALASIRQSVRQGTADTQGYTEFLEVNDRRWRELSHKAWLAGTPTLPRLGVGELLRTLASSKPFSLIAITSGPVYAFFRVFDALPTSQGLLAALIWWVGVAALLTLANTVAARLHRLGIFVIALGYVGSVVLAGLVGVVFLDSGSLELQIVFIALVAATVSLGLGLPQALERSGQEVLDQLEKRLDRAAIANLRAQGEMFVLAQRIASYLHSAVRGDFLRHSLSLKEALDSGDTKRIETALGHLEQLVESIDLEESAYPPLERLHEFLDNWASIITVTHNLPEESQGEAWEYHLEGIVMEAVNNAVRHGMATWVDISLTRGDQGVTLEVVSDSGPVPSSAEAGFGTRSLDRLAPGQWSLSRDPQNHLRLSVELVN
jgi:signal transduction histidine kinase